MLIVWKSTEFKKENIPRISYRLGYYEIDEKNEPFFVGSLEVVNVTLFYFFPHVLKDNPVFMIDLSNRGPKWQLSFIEIYYSDDFSIHYLVPRIGEYFNPYNETEKKYTEITYKFRTRSKENHEHSSNVNSVDSFHDFFNNIVLNKNIGNQTESTLIIDEKVATDEEDELFGNPMFDKKKDGDIFGFLWLHQVHWKTTYTNLGYCSPKTALPVFLIPFIDAIITSIGDHIVSNMLTSLQTKRIPIHLSRYVNNDLISWCSTELTLDQKAVIRLCHLDIANALYMRRDKVSPKEGILDYKGRFGILSYNDILNGKRTAFDPCNPLQDYQVALLCSLNKCSQYFFNLKMVAKDLVNTYKFQPTVNIVKLRIIGGELISLSRNGTTYGISNHLHPPPSRNILNNKLTTMRKLVEYQIEHIKNVSEIVNLFREDKFKIKNDILNGFNDVETTVYFIDKEVVILNPLLLPGTCLYGEWCNSNINGIRFLDNVLLLSDIFAYFYSYDHFLPTSNDLLDRCFNFNNIPNN